MSYITYEVKVYSNGNKEWLLNDELHREDGPALEYSNGNKEWYLNDMLHRVDGPAIECVTGDKEWFLNDELHREDGPAIEHADGDKQWFLKGDEYTEAEFNQEMNPNSCEGKTVIIEGKEYILNLKKESG